MLNDRDLGKKIEMKDVLFFSRSELFVLLKQLRKELMRINLKKTQDKSFDFMKIKNIKISIARVLTVINSL
ncbi:50S ribosomal protein L29 [Anaplasmataceae bacterium AB001_6]|nr:50S ribosomal protein L29 [Anaplasmataceae bacterium AB001_6]